MLGAVYDILSHFILILPFIAIPYLDLDCRKYLRAKIKKEGRKGLSDYEYKLAKKHNLIK